jgi:purine catabolism regulator
MTVTVQDVVRLVQPFGARLEAGGAGLGRSVTWVHSSDLPDVGNWLRGGEVILNTALHIPDAEAAEALVSSLSQGEAAAVIFADDPVLEEPARSCIRRVADRLKLPVILIPVAVKFVDVTQAISKAIISQQLEKLQYWEAVYDRFIRSALEGKGVARIVTLLAEMIRRDVALVDSRLTVISSATANGSRESLSVEAVERLQHSLQVPGVWNRLQKTGPGLRRVADIEGWVHQIRARAELLGLLVVTGDRSLNDRDLIAMDQAAIASALELLKERELRDLDGRLGFELVGDILSGKLKDFGEADRRAAFLGYDLAETYQVMLIEELPSEPAASRTGWTGSRRHKQRFFRAIDWALGATPLKMLVMARSDSLVLVVFDVSSADVLKSFGTSLISKLEQDPSSGKYTGGISLPHSGAGEMQDATEEARRALRTAIRTQSRASVTSIEDLGLNGLILGLAERELTRFCEPSLDKLARTHQAPELIKTVQSYLETDGSISRTATLLGIHRNTVLQRLHRVKEITGLDPQKVRNWLGLTVLVTADGLRRNGASTAALGRK